MNKHFYIGVSVALSLTAWGFLLWNHFSNGYAPWLILAVGVPLMLGVLALIGDL